LLAGTLAYLAATSEATPWTSPDNKLEKEGAVDLVSLPENVSSASTGPTPRLSYELRDILGKHWEAMGGNNWLEVESIRLNGTIERDGQFVDICIVKKRPDQIRATVTLPLPGNEDEELQVIRAHDGKTAWTATRLAGTPEMKKEELPSEAAAELLADAGVLPPLIKLWREGDAKLKLLDPSVIAGQSVLTILAHVQDSPRSHTFYLDKETYRLIAYESRDSSGKTTKTTLSDYVSQSGIYLAKHSIIEASGTGRSVMKTDAFEIGVGIYQEYFRIEPSATTAGAE
jgi:hypothetical protein